LNKKRNKQTNKQKKKKKKTKKKKKKKMSSSNTLKPHKEDNKTTVKNRPLSNSFNEITNSAAKKDHGK